MNRVLSFFNGIFAGINICALALAVWLWKSDIVKVNMAPANIEQAQNPVEMPQQIQNQVQAQTPSQTEPISMAQDNQDSRAVASDPTPAEPAKKSKRLTSKKKKALAHNRYRHLRKVAVGDVTAGDVTTKVIVIPETQRGPSTSELPAIESNREVIKESLKLRAVNKENLDEAIVKSTQDLEEDEFQTP